MPPKFVEGTAHISASDIKDSAAAEAAAAGPEQEMKAALFDEAQLLSTGDKKAAVELTNLVKIEGPSALRNLGIEDVIKKGLSDKKNVHGREGACMLVMTLFDEGVGHEVEPFIMNGVFETLAEAMGDKEKTVRQRAEDALLLVIRNMSTWGVPQVLRALLHQMRTAGKWQVKTGCIRLLEELIQISPEIVARLMTDIIPVMAEVIWDTKSDVQKASRAALEKLCALVSNKDIERFIPALIQSLIHPVEEVPKTIQLLSATTFVQEVDSPTLALMTPLLSRGLTERPTATKRKVAVIIDNMSKLVDNERTVRPFLPKLLPGLIKIETTVSDPEARSVVQRAINTLRQVGKVTGDGSDVKPIEDVDLSKTIELVNEQLKKNGLTAVSYTHLTLPTKA